MQNHSSRILFRRVSAAALLAVLAQLVGCQRAEPTATVRPTPVKLAAVTAGSALPPLDVTGVVATRDEMRLSFKVGGIVQRVAVREGDSVKQGQVLAQLDPTEIAAQVEQSRQMATKAERDLARGKALQADQVIPLEQLQNLQTQSDVSRSQLRSAQFNQQYARIVAPAAGTVLRRLVEERELAAPGQVALILGRNDAGFVVRFAVADRNIVQLRRGDAVELALDAWPGEVFKAQVSQVASAADTGSGLFEVEAALASSERRFVTGLVGRVRLWPQSGGQTLPHIPIGAILAGDGLRADVYVVNGDVASKRSIETAYIAADTVAVRSGLKVGEQVVAVGAPYLRDGGKVTIVP
jgi:membrane fusion protein, multidrug efflux system